MEQNFKECGKVYWLASNIYKIGCSICHDHIDFDVFLYHHKNHLNEREKHKAEQSNGKISKVKEEHLSFEYGNAVNNLLWIGDNKAEDTNQEYDNDEQANEDEFACDNVTAPNREKVNDKNSDEDYEDDFMWDVITSDSDVDNESTQTSITFKDEPLIDIQKLLNNKQSNTQTELKSLTNSEIREKESSQDSDFSIQLSKESTSNTGPLERWDDDDDTYSWDIDSCESDYPEINCTKRSKHVLSNVESDVETHSTFTCAICSVRFTSKMGLRIHMRTHQLKTSKLIPEYKCDDCGKIARSERALRTHKYKHTGVFCEVCNKQFTTVGNMDRHKLMHAGKKDYQCPHCGDFFYTISEMKNHCAKHTGVRRVICELCGKPCRDRGVLAQHMLRHTGERPVKCNQCNKSFYSNHDLKEHIVIHSAERPFVCETCGATFQRKKSLRVHKKIHSNAPCTEECTVCGKKFAKPSGLLSHMRVHDAVYGLSYPVGGWIGNNQDC